MPTPIPSSVALISALDADPFVQAQMAAAAYLARYSGRTLETYRYDLRAFIQWCTDVGLDEERAQELVSNIQAFGAGAIALWLHLVPSGATDQNALERLARWYESNPVSDRFVRDTQHSQRLILEELDRWS